MITTYLSRQYATIQDVQIRLKWYVLVGSLHQQVIPNELVLLLEISFLSNILEFHPFDKLQSICTDIIEIS